MSHPKSDGRRPSGSAGHNGALLEKDKQLCRRSLPSSIADFLAAYHRQQGVDIRFETSIVEFKTNGNGAVTHAYLSDGSSISTDAVVVGIGMVPDTALAESAGLAVRSGIVIDEAGRTTDLDIYAVGDVAEGKCNWHGHSTRIESWHNASVQANVVATSIMGQPLPPQEPPWFWSDQFDLNIQVVGVPGRADTLVKRDYSAGSLLSIYLRGDEICGAVSINQSRDLKIIGQTPSLRSHSEAQGASPTCPLRPVISSRPPGLAVA